MSKSALMNNPLVGAALCMAAVNAAKRKPGREVDQEAIDADRAEEEAGAPRYQITDKTLYQVCRPVEPGEDLIQLVEGMMSVLHASKNGVGLAANQVGDDRRVIIINTRSIREVIVNPVITKRTCGQVRSVEGCLSFDNGKRTTTVMRDKQVTLEGFRPDGSPLKFKLRGLEAMVAQHECDHLDGKTIFPKG